MDDAPETPSRFVDHVARLIRQIEVTIASDDATLEAIYRLRYAAYLKAEYVQPLDPPLLTDHHDHDFNKVIFAMRYGGALIATLRVHFVSPECPNSPAVEAFPDMMNPELAARKTIIDANRMAIDFDVARGIRELPFVISRLGILAADYFDADVITVAQRSSHQSFYKREFNAKLVANPKEYPTLRLPTGLMFIDFRRDRQMIIDRHRFYDSTPDERKRLFGGLAKACGRA